MLREFGHSCRAGRAASDAGRLESRSTLSLKNRSRINLIHRSKPALLRLSTFRFPQSRAEPLLDPLAHAPLWLHDLRMAQALTVPPPSSPAITNNMRANKRANTKPETAVRSLLHRGGFRFRKDFVIRTDGLRVRPDIVFTKWRIAVFIDGCFWHLCPDHGHVPRTNSHYWRPKLERNVSRDQLVDSTLRAGGWTVLRLWEHVPPNDAFLSIVELVRRARQD